MDQVMKAMGFMSGTSMDGIDVALIETNGESGTKAHIKILGGKSFPYNEEDRKVLVQALGDARTLTAREQRPGALRHAEEIVTRQHIKAANDFMSSLGVVANEIEVVGFHGQTVLHKPEDGLTVQIGDAERLSHALNVDVVYDMRGLDVSEGGQGAPLVPVYHQALVKQSGQMSGAMIVNIGGVGNVTYVGNACSTAVEDTLLAFDTGPGNALIDDWMQSNGAGAFDEGGKVALGGTVDMEALGVLLNNPYFDAPPPKSLDRGAFQLGPVRDLSIADGAATLACFTAQTIARASRHVPQEPNSWVICGGGAKNAAIMAQLKALCRGEVMTAHDLGWNGDFIEAEAFAYMAVRSLKGLPLTFPGTTGVSRPTTGGRVAQPG